MKKRLRKKLHLGEFTDLVFTMTAKVTGVTEVNSNAFYTDLFQTVAECGCCLNGVAGPTKFDLEVITGPRDTDNAARREELIGKLKANPNIQDLNASELTE